LYIRTETVQVYMGANVLTNGTSYVMTIELSDAYYPVDGDGGISDIALLTRNIRDVYCCLQNTDTRITRRTDKRHPSSTSMLEEAPARTSPLDCGIFPTSNMAVDDDSWDTATRGILDHTPSFPGYNWWYDPSQERALHFFDLDKLYSDKYHGADHVDQDVVQAYAHYALHYCQLVRGAACDMVADVGAAQCYFSEGMRRLGAQVLSIEGSAAGFDACKRRAGAKPETRNPQPSILQSLWCRVQGAGCRVQGVGYRV
jgi:hypothetical protein